MEIIKIVKKKEEIKEGCFVGFVLTVVMVLWFGVENINVATVSVTIVGGILGGIVYKETMRSFLNEWSSEIIRLSAMSLIIVLLSFILSFLFFLTRNYLWVGKRRKRSGE